VKRKQTYLPGYPNIAYGKTPKSALAQLHEKLGQILQSSLSELADVFGKWVPSKYLKRKSNKANSRERLYSQNVTFWAFLFQVLSPMTSCLEVVRKVQSCCSLLGLKVPGSSTGAYCDARKRLKYEDLLGIHQAVSDCIQSSAPNEYLWKGMDVKVVDGTGIAMSDTVENQLEFPQPSGQKPGCGFPVVTLVACFSLASGALLRWVESTLKSNECRIFRKMLEFFGQGDLVLTDRGYCSYCNIAMVLRRGADVVMRLHQARKCDYRKGERLGRHDRLVIWKQPQEVAGMSRAEVKELPKTLKLRLVRVFVEVKGFRTRKLDIVTTLLDPVEYSTEDLAELYYRRWAVELYFRDIKTTMGMDHLRGKSPEIVRKEIVMFAIAHNLIRATMQQAAVVHTTELNRLSFKSTVDTLRQYQSALNATRNKPCTQKRIIEEMLAIIAKEKVPLRENRSEPRAVKKRPKGYQFLTKPRHQFKESASRKDKGNKPKNAA
jgi:hypothetical protein